MEISVALSFLGKGLEQASSLTGQSKQFTRTTSQKLNVTRSISFAVALSPEWNRPD
jgi:hypothetical protein